MILERKHFYLITQTQFVMILWFLKVLLETTYIFLKIIYFMLNRDYILYYLHLIHFLGKLLLQECVLHLPFYIPGPIYMATINGCYDSH